MSHRGACAYFAPLPSGGALRAFISYRFGACPGKHMCTIRTLVGLLVGTWLSFATTGESAQQPSAMKADVGRLVRAAEKLERLWPWQGPIPEVARVVGHGKAIAPMLTVLLEKDPDGPSGSGRRIDWRVQQQAAIALCRIFHVSEECGRIYCNRATPEVNASVKRFWLAKTAAK